jgi:hypothetical protein
MTAKMRMELLRFILYPSTYVVGVEEKSVMAFILGYQRGAGRKFDLTLELRKHFEEKLDTKYSNDGWPGQIRRYSFKKCQDWVFTFRREALNVLARDGGLNDKMKREIKENISHHIERISKERNQPWFNYWCVEELKVIALVEENWFKELGQSMNLKLLKQLQKK